ncbi:PIF1-like helicase domain-containing protein [Phthorimaea operculella]|nr:PIF1-like helicase domain-containing protein [Phthorimaea operculella]
MRQVGDNSFVDLLNSIRVGKLTMEQLAILDTRRIVNDTIEYDEIVHIFPTLKQVDQFNKKMSERLALRTKIYSIKAMDTSTETKTYGQVPKPEHIPSDSNRTGGIINSIEIGIGSRVMLRRNLNINRGLVSGAMGVVKKLIWPALRRDQLEDGELPNAVLIQFDDSTIDSDEDGLVRIEPCLTEFDGLRGSGKIQRKMLPLILTWAVTVHKLQGCTLDRAVVDLGKSLFAKGQAYVALSRLRSLDGLFICSLDPNKLLKYPHDINSLKELERLRNLPNL